jgi:hypothetical protein
MPSSPILPVPASSRTPARTKRRSVSSTFSERLIVPQDGPALPDFVALLSDSTPDPLSTPSDKALLASLAAIGIDVGQMTHSVQTHACDASGAMWWMLKRKADEREAEQRDLVAARSPSGEAMRRSRASATPTMLSRRQSTRPGSALSDAPMPSPTWRSPSPSPPASPTATRNGQPLIASPSLIASVSAPALASYFTAAAPESERTELPTPSVVTIAASPSITSELGSPSLDAGDNAKSRRQVRWSVHSNRHGR